jgi:hypothetical protein
MVLWLALSPQGRRALRTPLPWLAAVIAVAVYAPNVAWNAGHGWVTFDKQFGRARVEGFAPQFVLKLAFDQALLLNPLIALFVVLAVRRRLVWPLLAVSAPFALYLGFHALHDEVQGQWPAPLYPSLAICAAAAAEGATGWLARLRAAAPALGWIAGAVAFGWVLAPPMATPFRDPVLPLRGWPAFYGEAQRERLAAGAAWVGTTDYSLAAMLSLSPDKAPATEVIERPRFVFETPDERADFTRPGLLLEPRKATDLVDLAHCFASVTPQPALSRGLGSHPAIYEAFRVAGPLVDVERDGCPLAKR